MATLESYGENFSETVEHLEEVTSSEINILTCLFVKESLIFSVLLTLHSHIPPHKLKKAVSINVHQNFNLLLWVNGEPSQHSYWLSCAVEVESSSRTGRSPTRGKNVILNADLTCFWGCCLAEAASNECALLSLYLLQAVERKGMFI